MSPGGWRPRTSSRKKRKGSGVTSRRRAQGADTARPSLALAPPSSRKLLLNLLPPEKSKWPAALAARRAQYAQFCAEMIRFPDEPGGPNALDAAVGEGLLARTPTEDHPLATEDHPLATKAGSKWKAFFADAEIREQIDRDVMRTHPDMHFFSSPEGEAVENRAQMKRALFVYAKLNPGIRYVQGMNEVYAPLYWAFRTSPDRDSHDNAEADAFFCFMDLLSEFRDNYCKQLDNSEVGIKATLADLSARLARADKELSRHLELKLQINPQFYAFRWITLLFSQEFHFPDLVRLWDTMLSDEAGRADYILRICVACLVFIRAQLLEGDFATCLKTLQRYPPVDVRDLIGTAANL